MSGSFASDPPEDRTILVVEDDAAARMALEDIFEALGCRSILARDGQDALEQFSRHAGVIDLVLSDLKMPRMTGLELYQNLKALDPQVKVVLATGYTRDEQSREGLGDGIAGWIQKPYSVEQLIEVLDLIKPRPEAR